MRYRYGFNGKEKDNETYGGGNAVDFGERIYNSRIGRFFSRDPLNYYFPYMSPYAFCENNPINLIDIKGEAPTPPGRILDRSKPHIKYEYYKQVSDGVTSYFRKAHYYNVNFTPKDNQTHGQEIDKEEYRLGQKWRYIDPGPKVKPFVIKDANTGGENNRGKSSTEYETKGATSLDIKLTYNTNDKADEINIEYFNSVTSSWVTLTTTGMIATGAGKGNNQTLRAKVTIPAGAKIRVTVSNEDGANYSIWNYKVEIKVSGITEGTAYNDEWDDNWENDEESTRQLVQQATTPKMRTQKSGVENHHQGSSPAQETDDKENED